MKKFLTTFVGLFSFMLNFWNVGHCIEDETINSLISFKPEIGETEQLLPVLKEIGKEDLCNRFDYASKNLMNIVKNHKNVAEVIDVNALKSELQLRKDALEKNNIELLGSRVFTEISLPLLMNDINNSPKKLSIVQDFVLYNHELREALLFSPIGYNKKSPTLDFIPDVTLMYRNSPINGILDENILCLIMTGIELDLQSKSILRGDNVPGNTRLLLTYFKRCKNCDNDPIKKIYSYQKYLTRDQNNNLSLQLLSMYLKFPKVYDCEEYMMQLAMQLFFYAKFKDILQSISSKNRNLPAILQYFLRHQLLLDAKHDVAINNFVLNLLNMQVLDIDSKQKTTFSILFERKLRDFIKKPIKTKFLTLKVNLFEENDKLFSKRFVNTMCIGRSSILDNLLSFFDFYNLNKIRKIFFASSFDNSL